MAVMIEMVSDLVCPWCWLGLRRARAAQNALSTEVDVALRFRPYQLDPTIPTEGVSYKDYMTRKFGGVGDADEAAAQKDRFAQMREHLETYGEAENIPFRFSGIDVRPNTTKAHRLVRWAQGQDLGFEAKEALFHAYFHDHKDIGDEGVLLDIAEGIGLDRSIVAGLYGRDADADTTAKEERFFRDLGISGVPTFIADRKFAIQGAETPERIAKFVRAASAAGPLERGSL